MNDQVSYLYCIRVSLMKVWHVFVFLYQDNLYLLHGDHVYTVNNFCNLIFFISIRGGDLRCYSCCSFSVVLIVYNALTFPLIFFLL
jgi:hypothetical protein